MDHHVGVDFSAAEAFVRIQRLLQDKQIVLVLCGCPVDSSVGLALRSVDLWTGGMASDQVEVFENLNDALEVRSASIIGGGQNLTHFLVTLALRECVPEKPVLEVIQLTPFRR